MSLEKNHTPEKSALSTVIDCIRTNNLKDLAVYMEKHKVVFTEKESAYILGVIEELFVSRLTNPNQKDFDALHLLVNANIFPLERIQKDSKIVGALLQSLKDLQKENDRNGISRIRNLDILTPEHFKEAA